MSMKGGSPECECPRQMGSALREPSAFPVSPPLPTPDMNNLTANPYFLYNPLNPSNYEWHGFPVGVKLACKHVLDEFCTSDAYPMLLVRAFLRGQEDSRLHAPHNLRTPDMNNLTLPPVAW